MFISDLRGSKTNKVSISPGATMISCFSVLIRKNISSLLGSRSLTVVFVLATSKCSRPAYWTVVALSIVVLIGIPLEREEVMKGSSN